MYIEAGTKTLLIRYSDFLLKDCINEHIRVLKQYGYCWFGKVGQQRPSMKFIDITLAKKDPFIVLNSLKNTYICHVDKIRYDIPEDKVYPEYYNSVLADKGMLPNTYFKVLDFKEVPRCLLKNFIVSSSRSGVLESLHNSMSPMFLIECKVAVEI